MPCNISVRPYRFGDDVRAIARAVYGTDPYIYPMLAEGEEDPAFLRFLRRSLGQRDSIFSGDNLLVAFFEGRIVGILAYLPCGRRYSLSALPETANAAAVAQNYFIPLAAETAEMRGVYINCLSVLPEYRRLGVGRALLSALFADWQGQAVCLDTLKDNPPAVSLYQRMGFVITEEAIGYGGKTAALVPCLRMCRLPERLLSDK